MERYLEVYGDEFKSNGYDILKGKRLKDFIKKYNEEVADINVGELASSIPSLAIFDFRAFLNVGMLLVESEKARIIRQNILDIVIDTINVKTGGATKYINQRDEDIADNIPNAKLSIIKGNHFVANKKANVFNLEIEKFLKIVLNK